LSLEAKTSKTVYWMHTRQLEIYRWLLWRLTGKIPQAFLVYLDENGNEKHRVKPFLASMFWVEAIPQAFLVYLDENGNEKHRVKPFLASMFWVEAYVLGRVKTIAKHLLEHGDMPRIPDKIYCPYCEFRNQCKEARLK